MNVRCLLMHFILFLYDFFHLELNFLDEYGLKAVACIYVTDELVYIFLSVTSSSYMAVIIVFLRKENEAKGDLVLHHYAPIHTQATLQYATISSL